MLALTLMGFGDIIDETDPCTINPSDPICQATAADTAADPCKVNPNASYCQAAVVQQSGSLPTPGTPTADSSWLSSFINSLNPAAPTSAPAPVSRPMPTSSASMASLVPSKNMLIVIGLVVLGALAVRHYKSMSQAL